MSVLLVIAMLLGSLSVTVASDRTGIRQKMPLVERSSDRFQQRRVLPERTLCEQCEDCCCDMCCTGCWYTISCLWKTYKKYRECCPKKRKEVEKRQGSQSAQPPHSSPVIN